MNNLFSSIPDELPDEVFETLVESKHIRVERILSRGQRSPEKGWYDQTENEWVLVLDGSATIDIEGKSVIQLSKGDYLNIPAHTKHRVLWTNPNQTTIWLAIFY